jgi:endogenous inhibitor of DNA gyrase (YacG/DUF329 family)
MPIHSWSETDSHTGRFVRTRNAWTLENFNDGHVSNRGRFIVYRPDYPRAWDNGCALRSHVHWWISTGDVVPVGCNLHHRNEDKLDDRIENLELLGHGEHTALHSRKPPNVLICVQCGNSFVASRGRHRKFCSQRCYHQAPKDSRRVSMICEECGQSFEVIRSHAKRRRFCSQSCAQTFNWRGRNR